MNLKIKQALAVAGLALVGSAAQAAIPSGDIVFDVWNNGTNAGGFTLDTGLNVSSWNPATAFSTTVTNAGILTAFNGGLSTLQWNIIASDGTNLFFSTTATNAATQLGAALGDDGFSVSNSAAQAASFYTTLSNGQVTSLAADGYWAANASQFSSSLSDPTDVLGRVGNVNFATLDANANASLYNGHWTLSFLNSAGTAATAGTAVSAVLAWVPTAVPLPAAFWLLGSGLMGLAGVGRRKGNAA